MIREKPRYHKCVYCEKVILPDYKNPADLLTNISDRGKILSRSRSGICAKHQRLLAREVKRARYLALLPCTNKL